VDTEALALALTSIGKVFKYQITKPSTHPISVLPSNFFTLVPINRPSLISEILLFFKMGGLVSLSFLAALPSMSALPTNSNPNSTKRGIAYPDLGVVAFSGDSCGTSSFQISSDRHGTNMDNCKGLSAALRSQDRH
jgi:hypothetical protein